MQSIRYLPGFVFVLAPLPVLSNDCPEGCVECNGAGACLDRETGEGGDRGPISDFLANLSLEVILGLIITLIIFVIIAPWVFRGMKRIKAAGWVLIILGLIAIVDFFLDWQGSLTLQLAAQWKDAATAVVLLPIGAYLALRGGSQRR